MADRVRMKSKSTFDNPLIHNHHKDRDGRTTVQDGDEFSTEEEHAVQLEQAKLAERIGGDASERTERQAMIKGAQTPASRPAVVTNRKVEGVPAAPAAPTPAAAPAAPTAAAGARPA